LAINIINSINTFGAAIRSGTQALDAFVSMTPIRAISNIRSATASFDNIISGTRDGLRNLGTATRMSQNALQGVTSGANPAAPERVIASIRNSNAVADAATGDWRVSLRVPTEIQGGYVLEPLITQTTGRMVFPFNPVVLISQRANYDAIAPTHTNYQFHAYQNSQIDDITITGDFYVENENDARYWIACIHFLRTMTKMFYGNGPRVGAPPPLSRLNGYGKYVLNNIPVLITNFTVDLQSNVDYIPCTIVQGEEPNYVPTHSTVSVTCTPNYARRSHSKFNLKEFANGVFVGGDEGFS